MLMFRFALAFRPSLSTRLDFAMLTCVRNSVVRIFNVFTELKSYNHIDAMSRLEEKLIEYFVILNLKRNPSFGKQGNTGITIEMTILKNKVVQSFFKTVTQKLFLCTAIYKDES